jgi:hypothetical protein
MGPSAVDDAISDFAVSSCFLLESLVRDLKFTIRSLRRKPGLLWLWCCHWRWGSAQIRPSFSVVDAVLLRPLPIPNPHELVTVDVAASRDVPFGGSSYLALARISSPQPCL